jgi:hypothetical protein
VTEKEKGLARCERANLKELYECFKMNQIIRNVNAPKWHAQTAILAYCMKESAMAVVQNE